MTVRKRGVLVALGLLVAALSLVAAGCGGGDDEGVTALPASSCSDVEYGGEGDPDVLIASDLPLQGGDRVQTLQMQDAIRFVLEQRDWKAGDHGKRTGSWSGKKLYLLCANCHNPHSPHFKPIEPLPPPIRQEDLR